MSGSKANIKALPEQSKNHFLITVSIISLLKMCIFLTKVIAGNRLNAQTVPESQYPPPPARRNISQTLQKQAIWLLSLYIYYMQKSVCQYISWTFVQLDETLRKFLKVYGILCPHEGSFCCVLLTATKRPFIDFEKSMC